VGLSSTAYRWEKDETNKKNDARQQEEVRVYSTMELMFTEFSTGNELTMLTTLTNAMIFVDFCIIAGETRLRRIVMFASKSTNYTYTCTW
jgi:hypothetical protein